MVRFLVIALLCTASLSAQTPSSAHTVAAFGEISLNRHQYRPLDTVVVRIQGRAKGDTKCIVRVHDPEQHRYHEAEVALTGNRGEARFTASGPLGNHYIYLWFPGERHYSRYINFRLDTTTTVESGDPGIDRIYRQTAEMMPLGRREYNTPKGKFVGYISADTNHFDGIWLRDWIYGLPAYRYWEREMRCGLDRFLEAQREDGQVPDGIERDGRTWRVGLESDVEYILTLGVWRTWQATGNDRWLAAALPRLERALAYIMGDPKHWDPTNRLVKRQHSCDTWDFDIDGASDKGQGRHVIATCDQSGYFQAFEAMASMYRHLGNTADAERWTREAEAYRARAVKLLWDGNKFLHHVHLDPTISHGDFDESKQLAMGNTWAITRGLASPDQSMRIVDEYHRRQLETGDAYPWWSLQPGYPDRLNYWKKEFLKQGGYANGGLMPWVGGELCRGAFQSGREAYGVELLRQYAGHLRGTGGAQVWYWPDGTPGFRTTNEVNYAGWGMAQWVEALIEGLAGVVDVQGQMRNLHFRPRWAATSAKQVYVSARYAASDAYFAYRMTRSDSRISIEYSGSDKPASVRVLLPPGWRGVGLGQEEVGDSVYAVLTGPFERYGAISIEK